MAKAAKVLCDRCESRITAGVSFCPLCRYPTRWASHEERVTWELSQWKAGENGDKKAALKGSSKRASRWMAPFARKKTVQPEWHLSLVPAPAATLEAAAEAAAVPTVAAPVVEREPAMAPAAPVAKPVEAPTAPAVKLAPKPVERPRRQVAQTKPAAVRPKPAAFEPKANDGEPAKDTPHTVLAMRLLNAKVAELEGRLMRLERELADARGEQPVAR